MLQQVENFFKAMGIDINKENLKRTKHDFITNLIAKIKQQQINDLSYYIDSECPQGLAFQEDLLPRVLPQIADFSLAQQEKIISILLAKKADYSLVFLDNSKYAVSQLSILIKWGADVDLFKESSSSSLFNEASHLNEKAEVINKFFLTPLQNAVSNPYRDQNEKINLFMIQNYINFQESEFGNTPLHLLIVNENTEVVCHYLERCKEKNLNLNLAVQDREKKTSLILAAKMNSTLAVSLLIYYLEKNAMPAELKRIINLQDNNGLTALHYAFMYGNQSMIMQLIFAGANINCKDNKGLTPLDYLISEVDDNELVKILISVAIDPGRDENATMNILVGHYYQPITMLGIEEEPIISVQLPANHEGKRMYEKYKDQLSFTEEEHFKNIFSYLAISQDQYTLQKFQSVLWSPEQKEIVETQLNQFTGKSFLTKIKENRQQAYELIAGLLNTTHEVDVLINAIINKKNFQLCILLTRQDTGELINHQDLFTGKSLLHIAVENNNIQAAKMLCHYQADVNLRDKEGNTPLLTACQQKNIKAIKLLLNSQAAVEITNQSGESAIGLLTELAEKGNTSIGSNPFADLLKQAKELALSQSATARIATQLTAVTFSL